MHIQLPRARLRPFKATASGAVAGLAALMLMLMLTACSDGTHISFLDPQGPIASVQRWHFFEALAVLVVFVAIPVFVLTPLILWRYRHGATASRYTPKWSFSRPLEIASWTGPIVIVGLLTIIVWRDTHALDPYKPLPSDQAALRVQVIGYDWKWLFIYPDQGIASIGTFALPAGRPVALQLTSATVMQSFHVPALGSQIYAMGGMVTQLNLQADWPGRSLGENTMYNGSGFQQQRFTAVAMMPAEFDTWVRAARSNGLPLDEKTLALIARRGTVAELIAALPQAGASGRELTFRGASAALFSAVVDATMRGAPAEAAPAPNASAGSAVFPARTAADTPMRGMR